MKFFLKLISVLAFLFTSPVLAKIDEYKSDLYYANGIMMSDTEEGALGKWEEQVDDLFSNELETYSKISSIRVSYNMSQGFIDDILEAFEQVTRNEWDWQAFTTFITVYLTQHNIQEDWQAHINDLIRQVDSYKQSIKDGHGVIVIAHSQGNYFTNEAYELLDDWMKSYFKMMRVATPANHVAGFVVGAITAPYVTFHNDFINFVITGLPSNRTDTRHHGFPSVAAHDFYESYLKEETTKGDIVRFIEQKIEEHTEAPSQWETDQEFERDTINYRITVKHRFDTSVIMNENERVYPFTPSKKLYPVNGEWVKASCGGENILASWEGQADNEFYMLEGTGEKIKNECGGANTTDGLLEVDLSWKSPDINLTLSVIKDDAEVGDLDDIEGCPKLHWYMATEADVTEGEYFVHINAEYVANIDPALFPEIIKLKIVAPSGGLNISIDISSAACYFYADKDASGGGYGATSSGISNNTWANLTLTYDVKFSPSSAGYTGSTVSIDLTKLVKALVLQSSEISDKIGNEITFYGV